MFAQNLEVGQVGESLIAQWLRRRGYHVFPAYELEHDSGKGPRLFTADQGRLILPDMLVFNEKRTRWVEAKHKQAFTWHRQSKTWQTGIDRKHWRDYVQVAKCTPFAVWLLFLHRGGRAKDTPDGLSGPTGLYGENITALVGLIHHEHDNHGPSGMVYWTADVLRLLASTEEVIEEEIVPF